MHSRDIAASSPLPCRTAVASSAKDRASCAMRLLGAAGAAAEAPLERAVAPKRLLPEAFVLRGASQSTCSSPGEPDEASSATSPLTSRTQGPRTQGLGLGFRATLCTQGSAPAEQHRAVCSQGGSLPHPNTCHGVSEQADEQLKEMWRCISGTMGNKQLAGWSSCETRHRSTNFLPGWCGAASKSIESRSAADVRRWSGDSDAGVSDRFHALDPSEVSSFTAQRSRNVSILFS